MNEKNFNYTVKDNSNEFYSTFDPIMDLSADEAAKTYKELKEKGENPGIAIYIPNDFIFGESSREEGISIAIEDQEGNVNFGIFGDTFINQLKKSDERSRTYIEAYKELYEALKENEIPVIKPEFVYKKEKELFASLSLDNKTLSDIKKEDEEKVIPEYFKDVKNPYFTKLTDMQKTAVIQDMSWNEDLRGEYQDKNNLNTDYNTPTLSFIKEKLDHKGWNNDYPYFNLDNPGQKRHYDEVIREYIKEKNYQSMSSYEKNYIEASKDDEFKKQIEKMIEKHHVTGDNLRNTLSKYNKNSTPEENAISDRLESMGPDFANQLIMSVANQKNMAEKNNATTEAVELSSREASSRSKNLYGFYFDFSDEYDCADIYRSSDGDFIGSYGAGGFGYADSLDGSETARIPDEIFKDVISLADTFYHAAKEETKWEMKYSPLSPERLQDFINQDSEHFTLNMAKICLSNFKANKTPLVIDELGNICKKNENEEKTGNESKDITDYMPSGLIEDYKEICEKKNADKNFIERLETIENTLMEFEESNEIKVRKTDDHLSNSDQKIIEDVSANERGEIDVPGWESVYAKTIQEFPSLNEGERVNLKETIGEVCEAIETSGKLFVNGVPQNTDKDPGYARDYLTENLFNKQWSSEIPLIDSEKYNPYKILETITSELEDIYHIHFPEEHFYIAPNTETSATLTDIPVWAVPYMANGETDTLTKEEIKEVNDFMEKNNIDHVTEASESSYFTYHPAFGSGSDCVDVNVTLRNRKIENNNNNDEEDTYTDPKLDEKVGEDIIIIRRPHQKPPTVNHFYSIDEAFNTYSEGMFYQEFESFDKIKKEWKANGDDDFLEAYDYWKKQENISNNEKIIAYSTNPSGEGIEIHAAKNFTKEDAIYGSAADDMSGAKIFKAEKNEDWKNFLLRINEEVSNLHNAPSFSQICGSVYMESSEVIKAKEKELSKKESVLKSEEKKSEIKEKLTNSFSSNLNKCLKNDKNLKPAKIVAEIFSGLSEDQQKTLITEMKIKADQIRVGNNTRQKENETTISQNNKNQPPKNNTKKSGSHK